MQLVVLKIEFLYEREVRNESKDTVGCSKVAFLFDGRKKSKTNNRFGIEKLLIPMGDLKK